MTLQKKVACVCHDERAGRLYKELSDCYYCKGTGFYDHDVYLKNYKGKFKKINNDLDVESPDESIVLTCSCGDKLFLAENDYSVVCSCGRIYRCIMKIEVDDTYIGKQDYLIELSGDR